MILDHLLKTKKQKKKSKETGHSRYIYQNEVDKAGFQHEREFAPLVYKFFDNKSVHGAVTCAD